MDLWTAWQVTLILWPHFLIGVICLVVGQSLMIVSGDLRFPDATTSSRRWVIFNFTIGALKGVGIGFLLVVAIVAICSYLYPDQYPEAVAHRLSPWESLSLWVPVTALLSTIGILLLVSDRFYRLIAGDHDAC